ncbi:MAG: hypothetical protein M3Q07_12270, partial [Pseudobdellovibrionaceae bacterium]|nr:hypothetical protein [Pseudobdellovibrionaceae bacterium]
MLISPAQEQELVRRIRAIESDLFGESILTIKAVYGVIKQGNSQNRLQDDAWMQNEIKRKGHQIAASQSLGRKLKRLNSEPRSDKLPKFTNQNIKPKPVERELNAIPCDQHQISIVFSTLPDYQEMDKYCRFSLLLNGFEYEVHV